MRTSTIEVGELVSTLSAAGVHRQLSTLSGVHHADVNYVAGSATVHYDEARVTVEAIRQRVVDSGYHCRGELVPAHACDLTDHKMIGDAHAGHAGHASHAGAGGSSPDQKADMTHDMGHAPGMSIQGMAACALDFEAGTTGVYQILASKPNRGEWPLPLSRGDLYAGCAGRQEKGS